MGITKLEITQRDKKILEILTKIPYLREDILAKYLDLDYTTKSAKSILHQLASRLKKYEIVDRNKVFNQGYFYWSIAKSGAQLINSIVPKKLSLLTMIHDDYVAQIVINNLLTNPDINLKTEYEIKQTLFGKEAREKKLPDIIIDDSIAIEVELTTKDNRRNISLINNYVKSNYKKIIYYSNNKKTINTLTKLTQNNSKFKFQYFENNIENIINMSINNDENKDTVRNENNGQFISKSENVLKELNII